MIFRSFIVCSLLFFLACRDEVRPSVTSTTLSKDVPSQISKNTVMHFTQSGIHRAILHAHQVRIYDNKRTTFLDSGLQVDFFNRDGIHSSVLTAARALINDQTKDMTAYDSVKVRSDAGALVETDSLVWIETEKVIRSEAFVRITEPNGRITTGMGFVSDQELTNYRILRPNIVAPESVYRTSNATPTFDLTPPALTVPPRDSVK